MNEAYSDYFPCSFFDDPDLGEWSVSNRRGLRNLDNNNRFPDQLFHPAIGDLEEHFTGLIWGGGCWTLRARIGARDADRIIFNSLFFLPRDGSANFQIGLSALLQADQSIFDGVHQETIRQVFNDRGICELAGCPLVSGISAHGSISSAEVLGVNQYTIEVPNGATGLQVDLQGAQTRFDIDLYVRFNRPVVVQRNFSQTEIIADHRSEGERGTESITITPESRPNLRPGIYYVGVVNWRNTPSQINYDLTATVGQIEVQDISLTANVPLRDSIGPGPPIWRLSPQHKIEIGDEIQRFDVIVTPDNPRQDLDFGVRLNQRVAIANNQIIADIIEQKPAGGGTITLTRAPSLRSRQALQSGTYYIAIGNFDRQSARFTVEARTTERETNAGFRPLTSGEPISGASEPGNPPFSGRLNPEQYTLVVPNSATSLSVKLEAQNPGLDLDLAVRHGTPVQIVDGQLITDFLGETPRGVESIIIDSETAPSIRGGTYYVAIGSFASQQADWTLTATVSTIRVSLVPTVATVEVRGQQQFNATVSGTENPTVIWQVNDIRGGNALVGTVDRMGLYTAPFSVPELNPVTVSAISLVDQTQSVSALVTIVPAPDRYVDLTSGVPVEAEIGPGVRTPRETIWQLNEQYRMAVSENARELIITVIPDDATVDLDFAVRLDRRVELDGRQVIADLIEQGPDSPSIVHIKPPKLQTGIYHIAVGNFAPRPAKLMVTGTVITEPQMLRVAQDGTGDFTSIRDALEAALDRATIEILDDGVYREDIEIVQNQITLKAAAGKIPTVDGGGFPAIVIDAGNDVRISGLRLIKGAPGVFIVNGANGIIEGNSISQSEDGICLLTGSQATIQNNKIFDNAQTGVCALDSSIILSNNEIFGNGTEGVFISSLTESTNRQIDESAYIESRSTQYATHIAQHATRFTFHASICKPKPRRLRQLAP